jgi:DtxR family transcriptional regulator, Mn-dependent transcriptional regulator
MATPAEENYLKAIFKIAEREGKSVGTNAIAAAMDTSAASVTDMLRRLAEKSLIEYEKYRGVQLTEAGNRAATILIRKHRLWEVFLVDKLGFAWDEVHEMAEQLEHIQGEALIERLDIFLDHPQFDPHGDPIPDANGQWTFRQQTLLASLQPGHCGVVTGVEEHSPAFLKYLDQLGLHLGAELELLERFGFDQSVRVRLVNGSELSLSEKVSQNLYIKTN